jgi:thiol-disulfide isomerase/thioredoxin
MKAHFSSILIALSLLVAAPMGAAQNTSNTTKLPVYVKLRGIDGKTYDVSEMKGEVVLVSFGATWCVPCADELKALEQLKAEFNGKPVRFVWVSIEGRDQISDSALRSFVKQHKLSFTVLRDPTQLTYAQFSTRVRVPLVVLFDREGRQAEPKHFGMATPEQYKSIMRSHIDRLLAS